MADLVVTSLGTVADATASAIDVLTVAEARSAIKKPGPTIAAEDLAPLITSVSQVLVDLCGPIVNQEFTETHDGGTTRLWLRNAPVDDDATITPTAVTEWSGTTSQALTEAALGTHNAYNWQVDHLGALTRISSGQPVRFASGTQNVTVTYTAGRSATTADVPEHYKQAAKIILAHEWSGLQNMQPSETEFIEVDAHTIPRRAWGFIKHHLRAPAVA